MSCLPLRRAGQCSYQRVDGGWDELAEAIRPALVEAIAAAVTMTTERIALLALYYATDATAIPPLVYARPDRQRKELIAQFGNDRAVLLPGEWGQEPLALQLPPSIVEACKGLRTLVAREVAPSGAPRQLMLSLATALAAYEWPPSLSRTDDFAVYAVDAEGEELERNLAASVPERQRAVWRRQGVLGTTPHDSAPSNGR